MNQSDERPPTSVCEGDRKHIKKLNNFFNLVIKSIFIHYQDIKENTRYFARKVHTFRKFLIRFKKSSLIAYTLQMLLV